MFVLEKTGVGSRLWRQSRGECHAAVVETAPSSRHTWSAVVEGPLASLPPWLSVMVRSNEQQISSSGVRSRKPEMIHVNMYL